MATIYKAKIVSYWSAYKPKDLEKIINKLLKQIEGEVEIEINK